MLYQGKKFSIRLFQQHDASSLALHANNYKIWKYVYDYFPNPYTYDDACVWVEHNLKLKKPENFAIVVDSELVGCVGIKPKTDVYKHNMEIGFWLGEEFWGTGITTEAVGWLCSYIYSNYNIKRIYACVFSNNEGSKRVLEKCGFKHEAIHEKSIFKEGQYLDELIYSLIK